jgi:hypothetical protein
MIVHTYWWLVVFLVVWVVLAAISVKLSDPGGRHCVDFPDLFLGCAVPMALFLLGIIAGLLMWLAGAQLTIGIP